MVPDPRAPNGPAGSANEKLEIVWGHLTAAYDALGTKSGERLPLVNFWATFEGRKTVDPSDFPELHAKAAVSRHCVPALDYMARHMVSWAPTGACFTRDTDGTVYTLVLNLLKNL